ncbi:MAG: argininosuccinate synthase [Candidatus Thermoplasmatota archaeon]|nr:argininosuccinate synthase [Candidatus Thermoplasmatota archaeon]
MKTKVILAYSGGLDTSVMLKWLVNKGYDVIAYIADVGQKEDFEKIKEKALKTGASKVYIEDLKKELVENYIFEMLKANAVYEGQYLLGTAIARPVIAKKQVEIAQKEKTNILGHGCTGKGNDQVRFELIWMKFMPNVQIISPWKEDDWLAEFKGRKDLINYAKKHNIPIDVTLKKPYSTDENLMHISYESGILEDASCKPKEDMFKLTKSPKNAPDKETDIVIEFNKGIPVKVTNLTEGKEVKGALKLFAYLNEIASENGIGRIDIVENRFVGIKSRGVYETPAGTILFKAHHDLESITLDREVVHLKEIMSPIIAKLIYNGFWYSPEMEMLMTAVNKSQENVTGKVYLTLYKGNVIVTGRKSEFSLYNEALSSMEIEGGYDQKDADGFIKIVGLKFKMQGVKNETMGKKL